MKNQLEKKIAGSEMLSALQISNQALLGNQGLSETLEIILIQLSKVLDFDSASIMLVHTGKLEIVSQKGFRFDSQYFSYDRLEKLQHVQRVLKKQTYEIIPDTFEDDRWHILPDSEYIRSWLGIPLIVKRNSIGVLNIDKAEPNFYTKHHAEIAMAFADQVSIAIEVARLLDETRERSKSLEAKTDYLNKLIASSFDGIITVDPDGRITAFNAKAEEILDCSAEEMLGKNIETNVYADPLEAKKIGKLLHEDPDGRLVNYETVVKNHLDDDIPIRLSATWLFDADKNMIGSVGYFKDLRSIQKMERHLQKLLEASNALAKDENLNDGLHSLAKIMVESLIASFCYILLYDADGENLITKAAYPFPRSETLAWNPQLGKIFGQFAEVEGSELLKNQQPFLIRAGEKNQDELIHQIEQDVELHGDLQSALVVPITVGEKCLGVCLLGEMRNWERSPITADKIKFAKSLTSQVASIIERAQLFDESSRRVRNLETLQELAITINSTLDLDETLKQTCQAAVKFFGVEHSGLVLFDDDHILGKVVAAYPVNDPNKIGTSIPLQDVPLEEKLIATREPIIIDDVENETGLGPVRKILHEQFGICSSLFVPVENKGKLYGSFSLDAVGHKRKFTQEDVDFCKIFAAQVASAVENARLFQKTNQRTKLLAALDEASRYIRAEKEPEKLLHEIVSLAAGLVGYKAGCLFFNHPNLEEIEMAAGFGLLENFPKKRYIHNDNIIREVAKTGELKFFDHYPEHCSEDPFLASFQFKKAVGIPLKGVRDVDAVLFIADDTSERNCTLDELEILERFGAQASIALQTSKLMNQDLRKTSQLGIMYHISDYIQAAKDLDNILHVVLTGVTAGYGLGFNRAAILLLEKDKTQLVGRMGIGFLDVDEAEDDWARHHHRGLEDFKQYLAVLEQNILHVTPIEEKIRGLELSLQSEDPDLFTKVVQEGHPVLGIKQGLARLPKSFIDAFDPSNPFIIVPLNARGQNIGILVADNKFTRRPITAEDTEQMMTFANTAAVAIENAQLYYDAETARERLHSFYKASNTLISSPASKAILESIIQQAQITAEASWVSIILIDELGQAKNLISTKLDQDLELRLLIRPNGISMKVLQTGSTETIEDVSSLGENVNELMIINEVAAAMCIPFSTKGKRIGVMWFHYDTPHSFPKYEIDAAQLFANQAAIAYDSARQMEELEHMRDAVEALSGVDDLDDVLKQIVNSAKDVLQSDSVAIRSFDMAQRKFLPESSMVVGIDKKLGDKFQKIEPRDGGVALKVMNEGWVGVSDILEANQYPFIGKSTQEFLSHIGARSFQGIRLSVGDEKFGVLYVNYELPHGFSKEERETALTFANQAAIALKKAKLLDQLNKASATASIVAKVTALGDNLQETLKAIVEGTKNVLGCDAITLYTYDQDQNLFDFPPTMIGVENEDKVVELDYVERNSVPYRIIALDEIYVTENALEDKIVKGKFTKREGIKSFVGIQLVANDRKIGVMCINYRHQHHFRPEELKNIELFAHQAAVAIRNSQLFQAEQEYVSALEAIQTTSSAVSAILELDELLPMITSKAASIFKTSATSLMLWDRTKENLVIRSANGLGNEYITQQRISKSTADKIIKKYGMSPLSFDIGKYPLGVPGLVEKEDLLTVLVAPLMIGNEMIGILNIYNKEKPRKFTDNDKKLSTVFADHAAIAIQNAQHNEERNRRAVSLEALYEAGKIISSSLTLDEILKHIAEQAWHLTGHSGEKAQFVNIVQIENEKAQFVAVHPVEEENRINRILGSAIPLNNGNGQKTGITVRAIKTGENQLVGDVHNDPNYLQSHEETQSEIVVLIKHGDEIIGAINGEHKEKHAFSKDDLRGMESLAAQAAVAIQNARSYEELVQTNKDLERTKGIAEGRTAMAFMGMASSSWKHAVVANARIIKTRLAYLERSLKQKGFPYEDISEHVSIITDCINEIREKPITAPLSPEEETDIFSINDFVEERILQLWSRSYYKDIDHDLDFSLDNKACIKANREWLRRALDLIIDNAATAIENSTIKKVTVGTRRENEIGVIFIRDTGGGIPEDIGKLMEMEHIISAEKSAGMGVGWQLTKLICQTYGGDAVIESTGPDGTCIAFRLPLFE